MYLLEQLLGDESRLVNFQVRLLSDKKLRRRQKKDTLRFQGRLFGVWDRLAAGEMSARKALGRFQECWRTFSVTVLCKDMLHQDSKFKNPISIAYWTDAFLLFFSQAIYLEIYPTEAPHLLKYCHTVRELQRLHGDAAFRTYDERFRKLKESKNVPWQKPISELTLKAATLTKQFQSRPQNQPCRIK